ncbi:DNA helicase Pif1-like protein [Artemisia annua]|uniref:DNA helicase Pif1-like protein n=1 Tax=Artemisia annua TaxID=35608 RepID=A0A2U1PX00_ARTAN|nr:DNA helicase Pif1-like protein [Artemisia annua]
MNQLPPHQALSVMQNISPHHATTTNSQNFNPLCNNSKGVSTVFDKSSVVGDEQMLYIKQTHSPYTVSSTQERGNVKFDRRKCIPTPRYRNINKNDRWHKGIQIKDPEPRSAYNNQESSPAIDCTGSSSTAATNLPSASNPSPLYTERVSHYYIDIGDCQYVCQYYKAAFWYGERVKTGSRWQPVFRTAREKCTGANATEFKIQLYNVVGNREYQLPSSGTLGAIVTAREKCTGANATEFKIQLYNVVGNREYQLPSSGTLGAIVFESGFNTQSDYDVIIEYKDRQPQRINKLHSSYMSLQYPLLFVYGQPSYHTKMTLKGVNANKKRTKMAESSITPIEAKGKEKILEIEANIKDLKLKDRN